MTTPKPASSTPKLMTQPPHHGAPYPAVTDLLHRYYEGLYHCDTALLQLAFHPQAHYATASGGELLHLSLEDYLPIVAARTSPARRGDPYGYVVESIEFAGPDTASVRMLSTMLGKQFIDFLSLLKVDGKWRIIAKVFHHEPAAPTGSSLEEN